MQVFTAVIIRVGETIRTNHYQSKESENIESTGEI